ncbi:type I restriction-modification system endonuclease [Adhaeribacter radiodurans]|uniref:Type I restriction-modification system endonuclease n=1 Tax=Adhaeribacter radiodurans TaxID=2745197 RepID=A0A7L7LCT5_9BACT|nr:type I restriction-modification system endonuclease [Adhaeribacter radiodurans]QMU30504.1 type I restriction-modification system endonuclease [Adhaeribacter radiodurans]
MASSNFFFLEEEFPILFNIGQSAEFYLHQDPVASLFKIRLFGERLTEKLFEEHNLQFPYENSFHNRIKTLELERVLPTNIKDLFFHIKEKGNVAVHQNKGSIDDAKHGLFSAFKLSKWFYETYSRNNQDISGVKYQVPAIQDTRHALQELETSFKDLQSKFTQLLEERETKGLPEEKQQAIQQRSEKAARKIEMTEAETRDLIDAQLRKAGWEADTATLNYKLKKTLPQKGKNLAIAEWPASSKWADYALFIGLELYGIVEAKKYAQDISTNLGQSKIYAELVQANHNAVFLGEWHKYKVPFLFSTNGRPYLEQIKTKSGIWFLDVRKAENHAKALQGWYSPEGLIRLYKADVEEANAKLTKTNLDFLESKAGLGLRKYQINAIRAVEENLVQHPEKKRALLAMATGTGKTRTIIGLCYHLIKSNRFNRILFLVDRTLLGTQALNAFKDNKVADLNTFAEVYDIKGLKDALPDIDSRLHFATVQSVVKRLFYNDSTVDIPAVDQYDCIIIDEAHRGYLLDRELDENDLAFKDQQDYISKYRMVLDYFDAYAIGLTATPALHTTSIFGPPVYTYSYTEAVVDGFLIDHDPPYIIQTKLNQEGIVWNKGEKPKAYDQENNEIIELDQLEDELQIDVAGFNKLVVTENFNRTVLKQLVKELDPDGEEKTLIFAATDNHADAVVAYLKEEFKNIGVDVPDKSIEKITGNCHNPQELVNRYKNEKYPNIAVTVDLLTTGIDVPAICNIVFLRRVKSRILYEQMLGRATRRCDEINKTTFRIFDAVGIYDTLKDYTQMKPVVVDPKTTFTQLTEELKEIDNNERARKQLEQIIAKLHRKKRLITGHEEEKFKYNAGGSDPDTLINFFKNEPVSQSLHKALQLSGLWQYLDELKPASSVMYVSEHHDEYLRTEIGYGKAKKPEDYLESFTQFIKTNPNRIAALDMVCTSPKNLNRQSLKELYLALDQAGFNQKTIRTAWKEVKKEDIAADIISYIRTLAMGNSLISHEDRIKNAVKKVQAMRPWNKTQEKWLDRFEKQLLQESILQLEDLDKSPFADDGGFLRLNKIFDNQLEEVISTLNEHLYIQTA